MEFTQECSCKFIHSADFFREICIELILISLALLSSGLYACYTIRGCASTQRSNIQIPIFTYKWIWTKLMSGASETTALTSVELHLLTPAVNLALSSYLNYAIKYACVQNFTYTYVHCCVFFNILLIAVHNGENV